MDTTISPVYLLRLYAWEVLKNNTDMRQEHYDTNNDGVGMIPIVPLSEEPELTQFSKPYLVYGYAMSSTPDLYARHSGSMTFAVYSTNFREITKILNVLQATFERKDASAREVNRWASQYRASPNSSVYPFLGIRFGYFDVGFLEGGTPEDSEGGRMTGLINIRFDYFVDYNVKTEFEEFTV